MTKIIKSITLFCTAGSSDKEYQVALNEVDGGYVVNFANGRRGSALRTGTKTNAPVELSKAEDIYAKLVKSKMSGGYTEAESGARYVGTDLEERDSGLSAMLPTAMKPGQLQDLLNDGNYAIDEKMDGENRQIIIENGETKGVNRRGLYCSMRAEWDGNDLPLGGGRTIIAGEDLGDHFAAFDLVEHDGVRVGDQDLLARRAALGALCNGVPWIKVLPLGVSRAEKAGMLKQIEEAGGEGIVAKRINAPYEGGRSIAHYKHKFQESSTFEVIRVNDQRSVGLGLYNAEGTLEDLGNVTIPANHDVPAVGDLVEVEYMMRYEAGALMQPKYKGARSDIDYKPGVDQISRIKFKQAA